MHKPQEKKTNPQTQRKKNKPTNQKKKTFFGKFEAAGPSVNTTLLSAFLTSECLPVLVVPFVSRGQRFSVHVAFTKTTMFTCLSACSVEATRPAARAGTRFACPALLSSSAVSFGRQCRYKLLPAAFWRGGCSRSTEQRAACKPSGEGISHVCSSSCNKFEHHIPKQNNTLPLAI